MNDRAQSTPEQLSHLAEKPLMTRRFEAFHEANPHVEELFIRELDRWIGEGRGKIGMTLLFGRARWVFTKLETEGDEFKLNDHMVPFYSRKLMADHPRFIGIMNCRSSEQADAWLRANYPAHVVASVLPQREDEAA